MLGKARLKLREIQKAIEFFELALSLDPSNPEVILNLGIANYQQGSMHTALDLFSTVTGPLKSDSDWYRSLTLLQLGRFSAAWPFFESRLESYQRSWPLLRTSRPRWVAGGLGGLGGVGERLLVWSEQGVGDEVFFASWLGQVQRLAAHVTIAVDARMLPIYRRSFPSLCFIDKAAIPPDREYDCHLPIGSIPKSLLDLELTPESLRQVPFLHSDPERVAQLRAELQRPNERLCGLTWRSTRPEIGAEKSIDLEALLPILRTPGLRFVSLQYGEHRAEIEQLREQHGIEILQHPDIDNFKDLDGHAALIRACDLVVSVCNATAHLAGAQGIPGYILAPRGKSLIWYWANRLNGHSLWYPTLELFEQTPTLSWDQPIQQIAARLALSPP
jgi:hypothetical protein